MKFVDMLKKQSNTDSMVKRLLNAQKISSREESSLEETLLEQVKQKTNESEIKPESLLRKAGLKIKMVTPTSFGTQIDFAKKYEEDEIKDVLKDFTIKIKNKSVFIIS